MTCDKHKKEPARGYSECVVWEIKRLNAELSRLRAANAELVEALEGPPHSALVSDACMSFRHDFGLLSAEEQTALRGTARLWLEAWGKAILTPSKAAKEAISSAEQAGKAEGSGK